ncbi:unnamed protein product [Ectocarpus sp. 6 AP-2014]
MAKQQSLHSAAPSWNQRERSTRTLSHSSLLPETMRANSEHWRVRYPQRTPIPRRPSTRFDARRSAVGPKAAGADSPPPPPLFDLRQPSSSRRLLLSPAGRRPPDDNRGAQHAAAAADGGAGVELVSNKRAAGGPAADHGRAVRFDRVVKLILVPSRLDLSAGLSDELWWNEDDYLQFRLGAIVEGSSGVLGRTLRNKRSRRIQPPAAARPTYQHGLKIAQALEGMDGHGGSTRPPIRRQFKVHLSSSTSSRVQPVTPPPSPANANESSIGRGVADDMDHPDASGSSPRRKDHKGWTFAEGFDGLVGLGLLPGSADP